MLMMRFIYLILAPFLLAFLWAFPGYEQVKLLVWKLSEVVRDRG